MERLNRGKFKRELRYCSSNALLFPSSSKSSILLFLEVIRTLHVNKQTILRFSYDLVSSLPVANIDKKECAIGWILRITLGFTFVMMNYFNVGRNTHLVVLHLVNHDIGVQRQASLHYIKEPTLQPLHSPLLAWLSRSSEAIGNKQSAMCAIQTALPF